MVLSAVIAVSALFGFWTWRKQRRTGYRAWYYGRWKKVDRARRRRIARAVRRGKAVSDPRDAALAVEMIDAQQKLTNLTDRSGWKQGLHYAFLAVFVASVAIPSRGNLRTAGLALLPLILLTAMHFAARRLRARADWAREKNEQLTGKFS